MQETANDEPRSAMGVDGFSFDAFLSYSRKDSPFVRDFVSRLSERGIRCWFDQDQIDIGDLILDRIQEGLGRSRYLIVCLSRSYMESEWCQRECSTLLQRELQRRTIRVLPVRLDDYTDEEVPGFLFGKYSVDVRVEDGVTRLVRKVKTQLQDSVSSPANVESVAAAKGVQRPPREAEQEGLDASVQLWFPHMVARSFFEVAQKTDDAERLGAIRQCVDQTLSFLIGICLADLAAHQALSDIGLLLKDFAGDGISERIELFSKILQSTANERTRNTFLPDLSAWAMEPNGEPTPQFLLLFQLALALHGRGEPGTVAKRSEELLRRLLASLLWIRSYRLIYVGELKKPRPALVAGKFKPLVGVIKGFLPETFFWQIGSSARLERGCYLMNPGKTGLLRLDPFLLTGEEMAMRGCQVNSSELCTFTGFHDSTATFLDTSGNRLLVGHQGLVSFIGWGQARLRIVAVQSVEERLIASLEDGISAGGIEELDDLEESSADEPIAGDLKQCLGIIQKMLLNLNGAPWLSEHNIVALDEIGAKLMYALDAFPQKAEALQETVLEWSRYVDQALDALSSGEMRRVLMSRRREVESALEDLLGGFSRTQSLFMNGARHGGESPYASIDTRMRDLESGLKLLLSKDDLDQSDGIDWLLGRGYERFESILDTLAKSGQRDAVFAIVWRRFVRVFLYYQGLFLDVAKYMLKADASTWLNRFGCFNRAIERDLSAEDAKSLLAGLDTHDRSVIAGFLALHVRRGCREIGMAEISHGDRWEILLAPGTHASVLRELIDVTCKDSPPSYIKAMFLLLRKRLRNADTPLALNHSYETLKVFYQIPLFLEAAFFKALLTLHNDLDRRAQASIETAEVGRRFASYFDEFRRRISTRDSDISDMPYVPLPIQRKLARDGYFVDFFICNVRDPIAMESVPHALRRPDVIRFFKSTLINKSALLRLADDKNVMREYSIRSAFCRNPKADPRQIRKFLPALGVAEFKVIAEDKNVNQFARSFARQLLTVKTS